MRRRDFITLACGAAAWPIVGRAQQSERLRRIGLLMSGDERDPEMQRVAADFRDGLRTAGWIEGRNVEFSYRWAGGSNDRVHSFAKELVALAPDLILTRSVELVTALRNETRTIPILMGSGSDPVEVGLVNSISRPGSNITGFMTLAAASNVKYLEMIKAIDPRIKRALVLMNSKDPSNAGRARGVAAGGPSLGVDVVTADVSNPQDIEHAIKDFATQPAGALISVPNAVTTTHSQIVIAKAAEHRVPAIYPFRYVVAAGGLVSYGPDQGDQFRRAASYADRILKGEKPGDLPIQGPTKFELVINLKTAKALNLEIPATMLAIANEVIE